MRNGAALDTTEDQKVDGVVAIQDLSTRFDSVKNPSRRLFIFSANDKIALRTQIRDIGTSQHYGSDGIVEYVLKIFSIIPRPAK